MNQMIPIPTDDPLQMAWFDRNDLGNAERLVRIAGRRLLWVEGIGWVAYDGKRWSAREGDRRARQFAHDVARHVDQEAVALDKIANNASALKDAFPWFAGIDDDELKALVQERVISLRKHAVQSGNASATNAMLSQAKTLINADREEFDRDALAYNVQNGTLRFLLFGDKWIARLDDHDPEDRLMQMANVRYEPGAVSKEWIERMKLVQPSEDQRELLQQAYGYSLTGLTSEQKWFLFQGKGGDGKSATDDIIFDIHGDYARHAEITTFLAGAQKSGSDHSSDMARLAGDIRFVLCEEPPENCTWNGQRLKQVTGSMVTARPMREAEIEFRPRWKLFVEVNPLPAVPNDDDGFWRRVVLIPWSFQFDKKGSVASEPMELLKARLLKNASGIFNWMVEGTLKWLETRRLPISAAATEAVENYRSTASPFGEWLTDRCDTSDRDAMTPSGALYEDFKAWCEASSIEPIKQANFGRKLRNRQHLEKKDGKGKRFRRGIRLLADGVGGALGAAAATAGPAAPQPVEHPGAGGRASGGTPEGDYDPF
ncbi:DNA primase family protein [Sphingomonas sp. SRS2]|uniref:DNA primase family protein n=1 Tax=Sphingomonas sp. SRS2 TaxID=133190 RepID=UPI000695AC84|nr:phage/plasmid primase, P4 family [Sphingomonas sp. SRS2]